MGSVQVELIRTIFHYLKNPTVRRNSCAAVSLTFDPWHFHNSCFRVEIYAVLI